MDTVDAKLVEALLANGRASYAELARLVGLSGPSVQERVRRLEERGVITGYRASVDPAALGLGLTALIGLVLADSVAHGEVGERLADVPGVEDCWFIAGDEAYMVKVRVPDVESLERLLGRLVGIEGVARTRTTLVISTRFEGRTIDFRQETHEPAAGSA
ncbi:Lrp/AsnC family transcriptional regulator [Haloactinopolyspora sp.]|uniref:Lrp/AsnC family transcriptional regulator n=1 Tax=Haloactinopolyspora sp. TaxID=1966353 RepID=UPI002622D031|nr:Lrp/AsnC family transcriptional regulator [Haloactinopolyspora sp.]